MEDTGTLSIAAICMIAILAVCFAALVGLVVTLPAVRHPFRRQPKTAVPPVPRTV